MTEDLLTLSYVIPFILVWLGCAWLFGALLGRWWRRVHRSDRTPRVATWLACTSGAVVWAGWLGPVLVAQSSGAPLEVLALSAGPWAGLWLIGVYVGVRNGAPLSGPPPSERDVHGIVTMTVRSWSNGTSVLLTAISTALVLPGIVLGLVPRLRFGPTTRVRLDRDLVELRTASPLRPERLVRLSLAGGSVNEVRDLFGTPILRLTGRDGAVDLRLGGTASAEIDQLYALLRAATKAEPAPSPEPVPEALAGLRAQAARAGQVER